jgi:hypothetical protein
MKCFRHIKTEPALSSEPINDEFQPLRMYLNFRLVYFSRALASNQLSNQLCMRCSDLLGPDLCPSIIPIGATSNRPNNAIDSRFAATDPKYARPLRSAWFHPQTRFCFNCYRTRTAANCRLRPSGRPATLSTAERAPQHSHRRQQ